VLQEDFVELAASPPTKSAAGFLLRRRADKLSRGAPKSTASRNELTLVRLGALGEVAKATIGSR